MMRMILLLPLLALFAAGGSSQPPALFQIFFTDADDRSRLDVPDIIPLVLMSSSIVVEGREAAVGGTGLRYRAVERAPTGAACYVVYPRAGGSMAAARRQVAQYGRILAEDRGSFFVQSAPGTVERLLDAKFDLKWAPLAPIDLGFSKVGEPPQPAAYNPVIQWIINQITVGEVSGLLRDLTGERATMIRGRLDTVRSRYTTNVKNSSAIWFFYEKALSYTGIDSVKFHPFTWSTYTDSNVVATKAGRVYPRQQYIICAHIDDVPSSGNAPGADDNGTSTIAALIAAKVMARIPFKRTAKYIAFNAEEQGIYGSNRYASEARTRGDSIRGVLNGEMLGYNARARDSANAAHGNRPGSIILTQRFYQMDTTYHLGLNIRQQSSTPGGSDHQSFWSNGFEAGCFWEWVLTPNYHTANDRISTLDTVFMTKMIKCLVATLCDLVEPDTVFSEVADETSAATSPSAGLRLNVRSNPSHEKTVINYYLPRREDVLIEIYGLTGRKLLDQRMGVEEKGAHTFSWNGSLPDGRSVPSGVYFVRVADGNESRVQRFVLLR